MEAPGVIDVHAAEQIEGHQQVGQTQPPLAQFHQQVVGAVAEEAVAQFLVAARAVLFCHFFSAKHTAQAVAPAAGVGGDGGQHAAHVRVQAVAGGELGGVLAFEAVGQVQPFGFFIGVEQCQADVGAAAQVGQAQQLAALEHEGTMAAAREHVFGEGREQLGRISHCEKSSKRYEACPPPAAAGRRRLCTGRGGRCSKGCRR
ncbi:hypothetical protein D3C85_1220660 [compost metagenome]